MNGREVRLNPSADLKASLTGSRVRSTLAKSTSTTLNACGEVALLITMWSPVSLRIFESRTDESRSPATGAGRGAGAGAGAAAGAGGGATGAGAGAGGGAAGAAAGASV